MGMKTNFKEIKTNNKNLSVPLVLEQGLHLYDKQCKNRTLKLI